MSTASLVAGFARLASGARARWIGCRPELRQRVYFANHTSHLDAIVLWAVLPAALRARTRPVAARDYWERGWVRRHLATEVFHAVLIDRRVSDFHHSPIEPMLDALAEDHSLILFPEGTRRREAEVGEFRPGFFHLAERRPDLELVPVYLRNLDRMMPRGSHLPVPLLSEILFGAPLQFAPGEPRTAFLARARAAVQGLRNA
jgi:1-acyl-sn-glycerol-3-phosphate acyltransferase